MAQRQTNRSRAQKEADELEHAYRGMTSSHRRKGKSKYAKTNAPINVIIICSILILLAVAILVASLLISSDSKGTILENVTVAGVDVGGMTQADAVDAVKAATENTYSKTPMVVKVLDSQLELPANYAGKLDVEEAVKAAYNYGRKGTISQRKEAKKTAATIGYAVDITPYMTLNSKAIKAALEELGQNYNSTLSQHSWEIVGKTPSAADIQAGTNLQTLVINLGHPEYSFNLESLYRQVLDAYSQNTFYVEGQCDSIDPDAIDLESILNEYYIAPVDALLDPDTGNVISGKYGYGFDLEAAKATLADAKNGTQIKIPFTRISPETTTDSLSSQLFRDTLATYTGTGSDNSDRNTNLRLACEAINGLVLQPGEAFSYNNALGERTAAKGYRPGPSYANGKTVYTIGGGICQVSSALYYCTMVADLEILLRTPHAYAQTYVPLGMDATVSWGSLDFRFRNNTAYPIRIEAAASGSTVTVSILGTDDRDYYVEMEYEIISEEPCTTTYKTMSADNPEGYKNGDYIVEPYKGYKVKSYRCKYNKFDDALISKDLEATSTYKKRDGIICEIPDSSNNQGNSSNQGIGGTGVSDGDGSLPPE